MSYMSARVLVTILEIQNDFKSNIEIKSYITDDQPVHLESMFPTGHGRHGKGTEFHIFNLGANTWQLHYLRLTNQLTEKVDLAKEVFEQMNVELSAVMRRVTAQGGIKNWDSGSPSVWLTAWVLRIFSHVSFQDWEDFIYIDPKASTIKYILKIDITRSKKSMYKRDLLSCWQMIFFLQYFMIIS